MKPSTFAFLTKRGVRNLGKHSLIILMMHLHVYTRSLRWKKSYI